MPDFADTVVPAFIIALIAQRESLVAHPVGYGEGKGEAPFFAGYPRAFSPDLPSHGFDQLFADRETQPCSAHQTC
jgi:hypothetical protein